MAYNNVQIPAGCTVKVGDTIGGLTDLGVLKGDAQIEITYDLVKVNGSKAESLVDIVKNPVVTATFEMYQIYLTYLNEFLDGVGTLTTVAASKVDDHAQTIAADAYDFQEFIVAEYQNADGTLLQIDATGVPTVSGATDGALTEGTDFFAMTDSQGNWGIMIVDSATVTTMDQVFTYTYDYTPAASQKVTIGDASASLTAKIVEFSKTIATKVFRARIWSATNEAGITLAFPDSAGDEPMSIPMSLKGGLDTTRSAGDQLIEIYDEIGVTASAAT